MMRRCMFVRFLALCVALVALGTASPPAVAQQHRAVPESIRTAADTIQIDAPASSILDDPLVKVRGREGLDLLYNMQFEEAKAIFSQIDARYPDHPVGPFLKGLNVWWEILLDLSDSSHDEVFYGHMEEVLRRCDAILDEDPDHFDATFFKGGALGFRARLRSNRGMWLKATLDGKRAIGYVRDVAQRAPENDDYVFGKGMYDYYAAIIPDQYPVSKAVMWMMPDGDKERGLELLKRTATDGWYIRTEALYFLTQIYYLYEDDYAESRRYVTELREAHPKNAYFHVFEGRVYARWSRWSKAGAVFREVVARRAEDAPGYTAHTEEVARYYLARERLYANDYEGALQHLAALEGLSGRPDGDVKLRTMGYLYQGMAYDALGRRSMAESRYRRVLSRDDVWGSHDRAERYLEDAYGG